MHNKGRSKSKLVLDISMTFLFLLQMAFHLIGGAWHSWLGTALFVLLILHNILDWKWYARLRKGRYMPGRWFHTGINLLLLGSCFVMIISAILLSPMLSALLHLQATVLGRKLHMMFTSWSFVLMSTHVGLHWNMANAIKGSVKNRWSWWPTVSRFAVLLVSAYGVYVFITRKMLQRMFLLAEYPSFDYGESFIFCMIGHVAILCLFASVAYWIKRLMQQLSEIFLTGKRAQITTSEPSIIGKS